MFVCLVRFLVVVLFVLGVSGVLDRSKCAGGVFVALVVFVLRGVVPLSGRGFSSGVSTQVAGEGICVLCFGLVGGCGVCC